MKILTAICVVTCVVIYAVICAVICALISDIAGQNTLYLGTGGRLFSVNGQTGVPSTVCSYNWEDDDATVVCKHLSLCVIKDVSDVHDGFH
jgi:hypothetical protein